MLGSSCRSVWRHVHLELRAAPGPLHVRTPPGWQGPVSLPQGISRPLPDFLCRLLYKSQALHIRLHERELLFVCFLVSWHTFTQPNFWFLVSCEYSLSNSGHLCGTHTMQYTISACGHGSNCKGLLISHFQGFSGLTSPVRRAIDQGSWTLMGPSRASRPPVISPFTPLTVINRPAP